MSVAEDRLKYPISRPIEPKETSQPPSVEEVEVSIDEPVLQLPYYQGRWRFLNRWVDAAHAHSREAYEKAVQKRTALLAWHARFNDECKKANEDARICTRFPKPGRG